MIIFNGDNMDLNSKMESIKRGTLEVVTEEELIDKIKKDKPIAYIGYEPSGSVHLGHAITVKKMRIFEMQDSK